MTQVRITQHCRQNRLANLPKQLFSGFIKKLRILETDPTFGKPLSGELKQYHSLRLGRYRILYLYDPVQDIVWVVSVGIRKAGSRDDVYEQLLHSLRGGDIALGE